MPGLFATYYIFSTIVSYSWYRATASAFRLHALIIFSDYEHDHGLEDNLALASEYKELVGLKLELEELFNRKVDVVEEDGLSPYLRDRILQQARAL